MAKESDLNRDQTDKIDALVAFYTGNSLLRTKLAAFNEGLETLIRTTPGLFRIIHSFRSRVKEPSHLREKIIRKYESYCAGGGLKLDQDNLGLRINDLVGLRILHLHTHQIVEINDALAGALLDFNYTIREGPVARTWDDELRAYYRTNHIGTIPSESMYTSVHYVVNFNNQKQDLTAEIQVRTLAEELWGEVEHDLNYPDDNPSLECREQIKVLARLTSGATRLVDSIYLSDRLSHAPTAIAPRMDPGPGLDSSAIAATDTIERPELSRRMARKTPKPKSSGKKANKGVSGTRGSDRGIKAAKKAAAPKKSSTNKIGGRKRN